METINPVPPMENLNGNAGGEPTTDNGVVFDTAVPDGRIFDITHTQSWKNQSCFILEPLPASAAPADFVLKTPAPSAADDFGLSGEQDLVLATATQDNFAAPAPVSTEPLIQKANVELLYDDEEPEQNKEQLQETNVAPPADDLLGGFTDKQSEEPAATFAAPDSKLDDLLGLDKPVAGGDILEASNLGAEAKEDLHTALSEVKQGAHDLLDAHPEAKNDDLFGLGKHEEVKEPVMEAASADVIEESSQNLMEEVEEKVPEPEMAEPVAAETKPDLVAEFMTKTEEVPVPEPAFSAPVEEPLKARSPTPEPPKAESPIPEPPKAESPIPEPVRAESPEPPKAESPIVQEDKPVLCMPPGETPLETPIIEPPKAPSPVVDIPAVDVAAANAADAATPDKLAAPDINIIPSTPLSLSPAAVSAAAPAEEEKKVEEEKPKPESAATKKTAETKKPAATAADAKKKPAAAAPGARKPGAPATTSRTGAAATSRTAPRAGPTGASKIAPKVGAAPTTTRPAASRTATGSATGAAKTGPAASRTTAARPTPGATRTTTGAARPTPGAASATKAKPTTAGTRPTATGTAAGRTR